MNIKEIVIEHIKDNKFDGLVNTECECGCLLDDLMPCDDCWVGECEPAYKHSCKECDKKDDCRIVFNIHEGTDEDWYMRLTKQKNQ